MWKDAFSSLSAIEFPVLAMIIFMVTFTFVLVRVLRAAPAQRREDDRLGSQEHHQAVRHV